MDFNSLYESLKKNLKSAFEADPNKMFRLAKYFKMAHEAMEQAGLDYLKEHGSYRANGVKVSFIKKTFTKLDPERAKKLAVEMGFNLSDISEFHLTEASIISKLGERDGKKVISELMAAGARKSFTTEFMRISVK